MPGTGALPDPGTVPNFEHVRNIFIDFNSLNLFASPQGMTDDNDFWTHVQEQIISLKAWTKALSKRFSEAVLISVPIDRSSHYNTKMILYLGDLLECRLFSYTDFLDLLRPPGIRDFS